MEASSHIAGFLAHLEREGASAHTVRAYGSDLRQMLAAASTDGTPPAIQDIDRAKLRAWLASLVEQKLDAASVRRKVAAVRSFFKYLASERVLQQDPARFLPTPRAGRKLPVVISQEAAQTLIESDGTSSAWPARDRVIVEFLYCGLRAGELVGINLLDVDQGGQWVRILGKGKCERQVPFGSMAAEALELYLPERNDRVAEKETALFLNCRGRRITTRAIQGIVKQRAVFAIGDPSVHPHSFRHAFATHLLNNGADLRAVQELLGHKRLSSTQRYTQLSLKDVIAVYDKTHPKA